MEQLTEFVSPKIQHSLEKMQDVKDYVVTEAKLTSAYLYDHLPDTQTLQDAASEEISSLHAFTASIFGSNGKNPRQLDQYGYDISQDQEASLTMLQQQPPFLQSLPKQRRRQKFSDVHSFSDLMTYKWQYSKHLLKQGRIHWRAAPISIQVTSSAGLGVLIIWIFLSILRRWWRRRQDKRGLFGGSGHGLSRRRRKSEIMYNGRSLRFEAGAIAEEEDEGATNRPRKNSFGGRLEDLSNRVVGGRGRFGTFDFFGLDSTSRNRSQSVESFDDPLDSIHQYGGGAGGGARNNRRPRSDSGPGAPLGGGSNHFRRERLGSMDVYLTEGAPIGSGGLRKNTDATPRSAGGLAEPYLSSPAVLDDDGGEKYLYDEFGIVTLSSRVHYYGPSRVSFDSSTYTPPTSWAAASRRIIPADIMTNLERRLRLDIMDGKLEVTAPKSGGQWDFSLPLEDLSMYVHRPLEGGVMNIYVKGTSKEEWMEHTFKSAHAAAQFQLDLLAYQFLGSTIINIFKALNVIHQGSLAFDGQEFVLHDDYRESNAKKAEGEEAKPPKSINSTQCVAWDDAMRSLSSIPTVRIALERLWLSHRRPSSISSTFDRKNKKGKVTVDETKDEKPSYDPGVITEEYAGKRLLLGPLDFYRLFVPALPDTAIPEGESNNKDRMAQLLSWRKRVSRAAVLVRAYTRARRVVNLGWKLGPAPGDTSDELVRRLAYDGNEDNNIRDSASKNEIYEASVSRDVLCYVRPFDFLGDDDDDGEKHENLVLSPYQAYSHVGSYYFKMPPEMTKEGVPLHMSRDPVEMFPSLKKIIVDNPDLDFLVWCVRLVDKQVMVVHFHVRSLSRSIDTNFDNVMDRYTNGDQEIRERKMYCMIQLGNRLGLSYAGWLFLRLVSFVFQLTETGRNLPINLESTRDRYAFPSFKVSSFFKSCHFGGALQTDPSMPKNYVAGTADASMAHLSNLVPRILFTRLQKHLSDSIVDMTYFLEGDKEDELPERVLCTARQVHVDPIKVAKEPWSHLAPLQKPATRGRAERENLEEGPSSFRQLYETSVNSLNAVASIVTSPLKQPRTETTMAMQAISEEHSDDFDEIPEYLQGKGDSLDPVEKAVNSVIEILQKVEVPMRRQPEDLRIESSKKLADETEETGFTVMTLIPVLKVFDRCDIERFVRDCDFEIKDAAVRLVETAAWRGRTFPLDKRRFRVQLQNGQFFQQGVDNSNNPVFYFRNMCRGPWQGDVDAAISAILYRLDKSLIEFSTENPRAKATLIVLMGAPKKEKDGKKGDNDEESSVMGGEEEDETTAGGATVATSAGDVDANDPSHWRTNNPRISLDENWKCHTNQEMMDKLLDLLQAHYPGRLSRALIVKGRGKNTYYGTNLEGRLKLNKVLGVQKVRDKVKFVTKTAELVPYVALEELCTIAGGNAPVVPSSYEF